MDDLPTAQVEGHVRDAGCGVSVEHQVTGQQVLVGGEAGAGAVLRVGGAR
ncbi:hypothetical protein BKA01_008042 [Pseudonocardia eucalypti]|nr:hypothetical protein [Pseudonocardia eucalypti]MBB6380765.1 hypothetical protein [Pseudonocardia eucalypti]